MPAKIDHNRAPAALIGRGRAAMVRAPGASVRRSTPTRVAMGRSQVVRQRILIPPFPGSNPGAPANQCSHFWRSPVSWYKARLFRRLARHHRVSTAEDLVFLASNRQFAAPVSASEFSMSKFCCAETRFESTETVRPEAKAHFISGSRSERRPALALILIAERIEGIHELGFRGVPPPTVRAMSRIDEQ